MISSALSSDRDSERIRLEALRPEKWKNPKPAKRYDLVIVGAGPAGATAADEAARTGAKTALVERNRLGGELAQFHESKVVFGQGPATPRLRLAAG